MDSLAAMEQPPPAGTESPYVAKPDRNQKEFYLIDTTNIMNGNNPKKEMEKYFDICGKNCFRQAEIALEKNQNVKDTGRMRATANIIDFYNAHLSRFPRLVGEDISSASTPAERFKLANETAQGIWWCCRQMMVMVREAEPPLDE